MRKTKNHVFIAESMCGGGSFMKTKELCFDSINLKDLYEAMGKSYKNAEDYFYEADLLYKMRRYGHSLALATFGIEELGKSWIYFLLLMIKFGVEVPEDKKEFRPEELLRAAHRDHRKKQMHSMVLAFLSDVFFLYFIEFMENVERIADSTEVFDQEEFIKKLKGEAAKMAKKVKSKTTHLKRWERDAEFLKGLQDRREIGMYIGLTGRSGGIVGPDSIRAKEARRCLNLLERYLDLSWYIPCFSWDEEE